MSAFEATHHATNWRPLRTAHLSTFVAAFQLTISATFICTNGRTVWPTFEQTHILPDCTAIKHSINSTDIATKHTTNCLSVYIGSKFE